MPEPTAQIDAALEKDTERWFARRGLPMFIENYSSTEDIFTRAYPVLLVLFVLNVVGSVIQVELTGWTGLLVGLVALVLAGVLTIAATRRGYLRRSRVGLVEIVAFVVVPALVALVLDGVANGVETLVEMAFQLLVVYVIARYALLAGFVWAVRQVVASFNDVTRLVTRALPLLLLFITFLFINTEVWQVAGSLEALELWLAIAFFAVIGMAFLVSRLPDELNLIETEATREYVIDACKESPLEARVKTLPDLAERQPLRRRQQRNLMIVMVFTQLVQAVMLAFAVWAFFMAFGIVAIQVPVQKSWLQGDPGVVFTLWSDHAVTRELFRVSTFIGAFSGLYFTVYAVTDAAYRSEFFGQLTDELGRLVGVRRAYLSLRRVRSPGQGVPGSPHGERHADESRRRDRPAEQEAVRDRDRAAADRAGLHAGVDPAERHPARRDLRGP